MGAEKFSWTLLFIVTAASFLLFSGCIKLLDGYPLYIGLFFKIGIAAGIFAIISYVAELITPAQDATSRRPSSNKE